MLCAGVGGFVGSCLRFLTGRFFHFSVPNSLFPWSTLIVNLVGCFLIGLLYGLAERHHLLSPAMSALLITGFCGGFTTFSSFADDGYRLIAAEQIGLFGLYTLVSLFFGLVMVFFGRQLTQ